MESRRVVAVVICLAAAAAFALVAFVSSSSYGGLLAQGSCYAVPEKVADFELEVFCFQSGIYT